jgi:hypothetical protein
MLSIELKKSHIKSVVGSKYLVCPLGNAPLVYLIYLCLSNIGLPVSKSIKRNSTFNKGSSYLIQIYTIIIQILPVLTLLYAKNPHTIRVKSIANALKKKERKKEYYY